MIVSTENLILRQRVGDEKAIDMMKEAGFSGIDYSFCSMEDWEQVVDRPDSLQTADALRRRAEARGICFSQSHAPFRFRFGSAMDESEYEYYRIVRSMEFASRLGAPMIVIHAILPTDDTDFMDYNLRWYSSFLPYAEKYGIRIAVENLPGRFSAAEPPTRRVLGSPETFCEIQDRLDSPYITGCLDIGHANLTYGDVPSFIRQAAGHIEYLHIHDNDGVRDMHQIPALSRYFGKDRDWAERSANPDRPKPNAFFAVPWDEVLAALRDIGYRGPLDLELLRFLCLFPTEQMPVTLQLIAETGQMMAKELAWLEGQA